MSCSDGVLADPDHVLRLPNADDFHVHLREGRMMEGVCRAVWRGGCDRALVMPNLTNPISTCQDAAAYRDLLVAQDKDVDYLMTLYLSDKTDTADLRANAKACHVVGVKSYPKGVTTNSDLGVESYEKFYPVFSEMEKLGLSLHLHGEEPGSPPLDAERVFLPRLHELSVKFPSLRIVLEHVSTAAAVEEVKKLGNVGATITAHHLDLTTADVLCEGADGDVAKVSIPRNFCKPLAKTPADRDALQKVVKEGHERFFLGSDSAPHPIRAKSTTPAAAGVFTSPFLIAYLADTFARLGCLDRLKNFVSVNGATFLQHPRKDSREAVLLCREPFTVPQIFDGDGLLDGEGVVVPYRAGDSLAFSMRRV